MVFLVGDDVLQLKPYEEAFYNIARSIRRKLSSIIICEGSDDAKILKSIIRKIGIECKATIGVSHGGGQPSIDELIEYVIVLSRLSRRLKSIGLVIDSEELTPHEKYLNILSKLKGKQQDIGFSKIEEVVIEENFYMLKIRFDQRVINLLMAISGLTEYPFKHHMIEDHALKLAFKEKDLDQSIVNDLTRSKEAFNSVDNIIALIERASKENIIASFNHLINLIKYVCEEPKT